MIDNVRTWARQPASARIWRLFWRLTLASLAVDAALLALVAWRLFS